MILSWEVNIKFIDFINFFLGNKIIINFVWIQKVMVVLNIYGFFLYVILMVLRIFLNLESIINRCNILRGNV